MKEIKKGQASARIFIDKSSLTKLSVSRLAPVPNQNPPANRPDLAPDAVIAEISDRKLKELIREGNPGTSPKSKFYGWAELSVKDARQNERTVQSTPYEDNEWHADIVLPAEAGTEMNILREHAEELARSVVWRPCPARETE